MTRPTLSGRLARWSMILLQFEITFIPLRAVKGQAVADFLAAHPLPAESPLNDDLPDEQIMSLKEPNNQVWEMYFDGAASSQRGKAHQPTIPGKAGIGLVFITPDKGMMYFSYHLSEPCTNNEAEYEALITGLELTILMEIKEIKIFGDSQLYTSHLLEQIPIVTMYRIPRGNNSSADALAKLAKEFACPEEDSIPIEIQGRQVLSPIDLEYVNKQMSQVLSTSSTVNEEGDWRQPIIEYLQEGKLPHERSLAHQIKKRALSYALVNNTLYRRSFGQMWLRCLDKCEALKIVNEVHAGLCGAHQSGPKMKMKIKRLGYYWPTMIDDCMKIAKCCHQCQVHGVVLHQPPNVLHPTIASWPFESWGTDIIGPIDPPSSKGHRFILAATDYFSKWAEAVPLRNVTSHHVMKFFRDHIVYRFGVPRRIISDNGSAFKSTKINNFANRHGIDWRYSTIYYPRANGLAEAFNKTLVQIIKKTLDDNKRQWDERLVEALWAYRTTYRTPTQSTPFALVYGSEAVLPLEVQIPSLRVAIQSQITTQQNAQLRLEELEALEGRRLQAQQNLELYKARMIQAHDKLVRPRTFRVGDLVLVLRRPILAYRKLGGKFEPTWEGPFVVETVYEGGSYQLVDCKGNHPMLPIHEEGDSLAAVACGFGGGSLVNAGVLLPTPIGTRRDTRWPKDWNKDWEHFELMTQILEEEIEDYKPDPIKLSINFDRKEEEGINLVGSKKLESCLACGNCLSGCPYNAKNSTDKNYLALAVEAGCVVRAEIKVHYIVKDPGEGCLYKGKGHHRRWRVYFNDLKYISSDFVVISAGVLGTTEILLKSQRRGLGLSDRLGLRISCNGNNVAYVTRSKAPLHAYGLNKKQFSEVALHNRPGPAISVSFTSSSGFTIQSGVLPTSYPYLFFKGISTYGWPTCYWFLHGLIDKLKCSIMGLEASHVMILNVMGNDACDGRITFDDEAEKVRIIPPNDPLLPKNILALHYITRKLGSTLFMSCYRSTSVHLLGGCNAASNASLGVCNTNGKVFNQNANQVTVHEGLYVSDASLIPCSIGTIPCLTITTLSEHISQHLVDDVLKFKSTVREKECIEHADDDIVLVKETMRGFIAGMPCTAHLTMNMNCRDNKGFGHESSVIEDPSSLLKGKVGGYVIFKSVKKEKLFIFSCAVDSRTPYTQNMHYCLTLASSSGSKYILEGKKVMNPLLLASHAWQESTTMHVTFRKIENNDVKAHIQHNNSSDELLSLQGELRISIFQLLRRVVGLKGKHRSKFICLLLQSLWRTYILQIPRYIKDDFNSPEVERLWKRIPNLWKPQEKIPQYPVLLLNGYSGEKEGYDIWLLQPRLHPLHPSNEFTIEDIGKFDIPAVIAKIREVHGPFSRIHVIAHCVGGLAIHIALMGGHVSSSKIASLSCTNSSMFFKLSNYALVKMRLPLLPVTMAVLGRNKTLSITDSSKDEFRHTVLKQLARIIPRTERCTSDECEIFSGTFGNAFWHANISKTLHQWLSKQNVTHLPMYGFPHLRKICNAGFIIDAEGKDMYLIHSERMAMPTLYIYGRRSLLVTPETSMLGYWYMWLHQPGFQHKRVMMEGYGHSDLPIGEESYMSVFPHFISHMKMVEGGGRRKGREENVVYREAYYDDNGGSRGFTFFICLIAIFYFFLSILSLAIEFFPCRSILL
ncbi:hypothetical protein KFK09_007165 [Dendrobium nobile]|uniref:Uncharacterized protein n=1 Tax=Dendrobium nobile TaxID=94219 RepID=A0A8T3BUE7_DENNO|nr:hypothetical protein KFK09_007165 [Dendrobium nobile]